MEQRSAENVQHFRAQRELDLCRLIGAEFEARRFGGDALEIFRARFPKSLSLQLIEHAYTRAAIGAGTTVSGNGGVLVPELAAAFLAATRPFTLIGRLALRRVPFATPVVRRATGTAAGFAWRGAGLPAPLMHGAFERETLPVGMATGICVQTEELLRLAARGSAEFLRDELRRDLIAFLDTQFVDPSNAGTDTSPAAITYGVTPAMSSLGDPMSDLLGLLSAYRSAGGQFSTLAVLISSANCAALALRTGGDGQPLFPGLTVQGGVIAGAPAFASDSVGDRLVAVDAAQVSLADDSEASFEFSRQAALEMLDNPTNSAQTGTAASMTSMFQTGTVAIKVDRTVNWRRYGAIALVDEVDYLTAGSPS
jgi:HK97 family phage major capsid protein